MCSLQNVLWKVAESSSPAYSVCRSSQQESLPSVSTSTVSGDNCYKSAAAATSNLQQYHADFCKPSQQCQHSTFPPPESIFIAAAISSFVPYPSCCLTTSSASSFNQICQHRQLPQAAIQLSHASLSADTCHWQRTALALYFRSLCFRSGFSAIHIHAGTVKCQQSHVEVMASMESVCRLTITFQPPHLTVVHLHHVMSLHLVPGFALWSHQMHASTLLSWFRQQCPTSQCSHSLFLLASPS